MGGVCSTNDEHVHGDVNGGGGVVLWLMMIGMISVMINWHW